MSYILDALKKSEREKTLGQVPTLETVISDGAKKQRSGTPWWINVLVFVVALIAVLGVLKLTNLVDFSNSKSSSDDTIAASSESEPVQDDSNQQTQSDLTLVDNNDVSTQGVQTQTDLVQTNQVQQDEQAEQAQIEQVEPQPPIPQAEEIVELGQSELTAQADQGVVSDQQSAQQTIEMVAEPAEMVESVEPVETVEPVIAESPQPVEQATQVAVSEQVEEDNYETDLHQELRSISVNVVSYSSEATQRFVMLDLTIYKEGDLLPNDAEVLTIIRNGAIVEFKNKRYLLKP